MPLPPRRPTVFRPSGPAQMRVIQRFWYQIRVAEQGQELDLADHDALELDDPLRAHGELFALRTEASVIGTAILIPCEGGGGEELAALYDMKSLGSIHPEHTGILAGLALGRDHRRAGPLFMLLAHMFRFALMSGLRIVATDTDENLLGPLLDLGFLPWGGSFEDPERGRRYVLRLDCCNLKHLAAMQSPLLEIAQSAQRDRDSHSNHDAAD